MGCLDTLYSSRECSTNQTFFAKQTQSQVLRIWLSSLTTSKYGEWTFGEMRKQSQYKPNTNPIQSQTKPILAQKQRSEMKTKPIKPKQTQSCRGPKIKRF
jgi:hypothetical protein